MVETPLNISVIITTYNQPEWLRKTLWGFDCQTNRNFEIVIADDGSGNETREVIAQFQKSSTLNIQHVWHEDNGFRKCEILNKAILASTYDYLLFTDGDCVPRVDFIEEHVKAAEKGRFLSGGYFKLNTAVSNLIAEDDIKQQRAFSIKWLLQHGLQRSFKLVKLVKSRLFRSAMNAITPTKATWNGHNTSGWKTDILAVNGYNEDMQYGGLDRELGERLENAGIRGKQIRYNAICVHLNHPRPYRTSDTLSKNRAIRDRVKAEKIVWAEKGIVKK